MAKTNGPLFSLAAHGSIGKELTYSDRKGTKQVRFQRKQKDYENTARKTARDAYRWAIELWNALPSAEKAYWTEVEQKGYANV